MYIACPGLISILFSSTASILVSSRLAKLPVLRTNVLAPFSTVCFTSVAVFFAYLYCLGASFCAAASTPTTDTANANPHIPEKTTAISPPIVCHGYASALCLTLLYALFSSGFVITVFSIFVPRSVTKSLNLPNFDKFGSIFNISSVKVSAFGSLFGCCTHLLTNDLIFAWESLEICVVSVLLISSCIYEAIVLSLWSKPFSLSKVAMIAFLSVLIAYVRSNSAHISWSLQTFLDL